ncbi:hypothetical protein PHYBOEH_004425 [Phytophthora boehmeriae]|uniref:Uncharacterized protein n=1 Tax=Phytophthora boehmeriae TaxID=109152 RepID=A0A8T1WSU1_9STRA|nr:hypothetical protein PHYBOEH_004425 [Phytophthora boehmeriae]
MTPLSFNRPDLPREIVESYLDYERAHLQAYWESTHFLPITPDMYVDDASLRLYHSERKQRRARAGTAWRAFLQLVMSSLRARDFDLDLLLDPFFLHFPMRKECKYWYPGIEIPDKTQWPATLREALEVTHLHDPWRNHYRDHAQAHPAESVARLRGKFVTPTA